MKTAFLVTGADFRHRKLVLRFRKHLEKVGCWTEVASAHSPFFLSDLEALVSRTQDESIFLFAFNGHGDPKGYEGGVRYPELSNILSRIKGKLLIINDTCYGAKLLEHVKTKRSHHSTCFISPWDSDGISYGGPVADAVNFWPQAKVIEDLIPSIIYSTDTGDTEHPVQKHWGSRFEYYFFHTSEIADL